MEILRVAPFLDYYARIRSRTKRLLAVVPPEALDFSYKPEKFTVADQIRHIAAIERYMFAETVAGRASVYQGCGPELADGYDAVMNYLDRLHEESLSIFRMLNDDDLRRSCETPGGAVLPVWKWLRALIEHEIHHRAQLYLYLNLLDVKTPPIFGLTAEEVQANSLPALKPEEHTQPAAQDP